MSEVQKVIKYIATAFAILLAVGIITGIVSAAFAVVHTVSGGRISFRGRDEKTIDFTDSFTDVKSLDINNSSGSLKIMVGETFKVEAEKVPEGFEAKVTGSGKLVISDREEGIQFLWFNFGGFDNPNSKITLYVPADFIAKEAKIDNGAGSVSLEGLQAKELTISAGTGNITGSNLAADKVKIDGGVGNVTFSDVNFKDADFDCGVGDLNIDGVLLGKNEIDCGVGSVDLDLIGIEDNYDFNVDTGVGTVKINGKKVSGDRKTDKNADNSIKIDGGVGDVRIDFAE